MQVPLYVMLIGDPAGEVVGPRPRAVAAASCSTWCRPPTAPRAAPLAQTVAAFFKDDGVLLRKFVYRVAPDEGLAAIEPVVKRIAPRPRAGIELRIFGYFVLPLLLILVALLGLLVRSFPGPGDLEIVELAVDKPVHVATDRIHRAPDGTWSAQGLYVGGGPAHRRRHAHAAGARAGADRQSATHERARPPRRRASALGLDGVRRALDAATDSGSREDRIHALNLDYAARGLESREAERLLLRSPAERARLPRPRLRTRQDSPGARRGPSPAPASSRACTS